MTEKSQDESAETLSAAEESGAGTETSPASTEDSSAAVAAAEPDAPPRPQTQAADAPAEDAVAEDAPAESIEAADTQARTASPTSQSSAVEESSAAEPSTPETSAPKSPATGSPASGSSAPATSGPSVRWSRPTPARPTPSAAKADETDVSGFFDNLDEKFMGAARRLGAAFRRTPSEDTSDSAQLPSSGSSNHTAPADSAPRGPDASGRRASAGAGSPTRAASGPETPEAGTEQAPLSLPRPRRSLDEQRQRDVILKKAAAIEAATALNYRPTGREVVESADEEEDLFTYIPPYNLPSRDPDPAPVRTDLYRQIFVTVGALAALASLVWMFGIFPASPAILGGTGLDELAGGWYSGEQALLSPHANFYWLWPIIVLGLLAHAVHQWTTTQISTPRQRRSGWQVGSASLLMLVWTFGVHQGMLTLSVLASLAAALALIDAIRQFTFRTARTGAERRFSDTTTGLFTGWAMVAAMSSLSIWLTAMGWRVPGIPAVIWALLGLGICIWAAAYYAMTERGRIAVALGMGWGMFWLIFPRLLSDVTSVWVAICAAMGAFVVILATESRRHKINHAERRAAMGRPLEDII